jgi:hypothetical protein
MERHQLRITSLNDPCRRQRQQVDLFVAKSCGIGNGQLEVPLKNLVIEIEKRIKE